MPQFLDKSNDCAQKLLQLVSKGTVVIAELMYLSDNIPESLLRYNDPNNPESQILFDFGFFGLEQIEEDKIDADEVLFQLDEDFRETHEDIVARFYRLFHSIYSFHLELSEWIEDLQNDVFIQQTLESVLFNEEGKQILSEGIYLFGVMLLLLDEKIPGPIREALIVCHYRYSNSSYIPDFDKVTTLCGDTGFRPGPHPWSPPKVRPQNYPEVYFSRLPLPTKVIRMVLERLSSDDCYHQ